MADGMADSELGKTILFILAALYELSNLGLIEYNASSKITPKGIALFDQLRVNWQPDKKTLDMVVKSKALAIDGVDNLTELMQLWLNGELDAQKNR